MVARSRCTTETVEPCVMGIVACGTVLVSGLRACGRAVWRREDRTGAPRTVPQQRSTEGRQAMPRGDEEAKARSDPLGPCGPRVTPLGVARRPHAQDDDASKRGGSRGTPWRAVGGARGGHGSRTRGLAPQGGQGVRSIPVPSCRHCPTRFGRRAGGAAGGPRRSRQRRRGRALGRGARKPYCRSRLKPRGNPGQRQRRRHASASRVLVWPRLP